MTGLVSVIQHQSLPYVPLHVSDLLLTLHRPDNIELWDPHDTLSAFWEISNQVTMYPYYVCMYMCTCCRGYMYYLCTRILCYTNSCKHFKERSLLLLLVVFPTTEYIACIHTCTCIMMMCIFTCSKACVCTSSCSVSVFYCEVCVYVHTLKHVFPPIM